MFFCSLRLSAIYSNRGMVFTIRKSIVLYTLDLLGLEEVAVFDLPHELIGLFRQAESEDLEHCQRDVY